MGERSAPAAVENDRRRSWPWLPFYGLLTLLLLCPMSFELDRRLPDDSDALQNLWIVWWGATHLDLGYPKIFDANGYYPNPRPLAYSEPQFAQALLSWPLFRWLDNRVLSYNLLVALSLSLSAFAAHLFLREIVGSTWAAFVGAVVYAFSAYSFSQLARSQLVSLQWMPLALLCLHRFFAQNRKVHLLGFSSFPSSSARVLLLPAVLSRGSRIPPSRLSLRVSELAARSVVLWLAASSRRSGRPCISSLCRTSSSSIDTDSRPCGQL
jgi:hypothetical protein